MLTGWLVENENTQWLSVCADGGALEWTGDSNKALYFAAEEDAFDFITLLPTLGITLSDDAKGATEHIWLDAINTAASGSSPA